MELLKKKRVVICFIVQYDRRLSRGQTIFFSILNQVFPFLKTDEITVVDDLAKFEVQFVLFDFAHFFPFVFSFPYYTLYRPYVNGVATKKGQI